MIPRGSSDPYYDLIEDYNLIVSSFQSQYGIRLSKEINTMPWDEFRDLLVGIAPDTALGRIVAIRAEEDEEMLKHFSKEQHRIRNAWRSRKAKQVTGEDMDAMLNHMKDLFLSMSGR